jgi:hypothetical protein
VLTQSILQIESMMKESAGIAAVKEVPKDPAGDSSINESEMPKARLWLGVGEVVRTLP